jgi:hypothetical protein
MTERRKSNSIMKTWRATRHALRPMNDLSLRTGTLRNRAQEQAGIMLVDCLVYLAIWGVVVGLAFAAYFRSVSYSKNLARNAEDIARALKAGERWREDVRAATGPFKLVTWEASVAQALHIPQKTDVVIYLFKDGAVLRQRGTNTPWIPALSGVKSSRMEKDERRRVVSWRWEVELQNKQKVARVRPLFTFQAVTPEHKVR